MATTTAPADTPADSKADPAQGTPAKKKAGKKKAASKKAAGKKAARPAGISQRQTDIPASELDSGDPCPFTAGCNGVLRVYSSSRREEFDAETGRRARTLRIQNLHCPVCKCLPKNPKIVTMSRAGEGLLDRGITKRKS